MIYTSFQHIDSIVSNKLLTSCCWKISLHYIGRINHLRLRSECPYSHKVKPNVLKIIGTAKFWSIIVSLMDHWINYTMVLYVVTKSWLLSSNQYFMNSWHKKGLWKERRVQVYIEINMDLYKFLHQFYHTSRARHFILYLIYFLSHTQTIDME